MLKKLRNVYLSHGLFNLIHLVAQKVFRIRASCYPIAALGVTDKSGLEIGGFSGVFSNSGIIPVYDLVNSLDNCNFDRFTTWEGDLANRPSYKFSSCRSPGRQFIAESTDLHFSKDISYDFILSSHVLEHCANPLKVIFEWMRVVRDGGVLIILLPHKDGAFDRRRPVTTLEHLIADYEANIGEDDLTHLSEILELHDLRRDPSAGNARNFEQRCLSNLKYRCLHHHVFDSLLVAQMLDYAGLELLSIEAIRPNHVVAVVRKPLNGIRPDNRSAHMSLFDRLEYSPFPSDRDAYLKCKSSGVFK